MGRQRADMAALLSAIGARLRMQYADVLNGEFPKKIAELATQIDQPTEAWAMFFEVGLAIEAFMD